MENCSLDLCLSPVTSSLQSCHRDSKVSQSLATRTKEINAFYNGRVLEYDLVEIQIRAVIEMASKERDITVLELAPVRLESPLVFPVKRSVERFLEKRKKRSKYVTTPYSYTCSSTSSSSSHHF
ncbi:hypothetical protein F2Q68_00016869 [Brassica cretica]|uniref:Uncharacterized protein n=2 Tax=Brassica cretica TaxID=69181 RepID=A0A8S9HJZ9_BRACR|nr:hypothetical protein F2Q68_00016869 [Brassica cretica]KAF3607201.1 hypothetical protein DY000_02049272 [Brassica cretica]